MNEQNSKRAIESRSYWYYLAVVVGAVIAAIMADDSFKELIGSYFVLFIIADKMISAYLRTITEKKIEFGKPKLNPLEAALRQDDIDIKEV